MQEDSFTFFGEEEDGSGGGFNSLVFSELNDVGFGVEGALQLGNLIGFQQNTDERILIDEVDYLNESFDLQSSVN